MSKIEKLKKKIAAIIFWVILMVSFVFFASLIHLKANGWQLNYRTWQLTRTGMITLNGTPRDVEIKVNNIVKSNSFPTKIGNLSPGYYDVVITAPNYQSWQKTIQVFPGKASVNQNIVLFLQNSSEAAVPTDITGADFQKMSSDNDLKFKGSEIFWQENLVSRFSQNILMATTYPDGAHIVFQVENEIRVIDLDGSNNRLLFKLETNSPTKIIFKSSGDTCYFIDNGKISGRIIR